MLCLSEIPQLRIDGQLRSMAAYGFPDDWPIGGRVDLGCHGPIRPGSSLSFDAVHDERQPAKGGLISLPLIASPREVKQLLDAVRRRRIRWRSVVNPVRGIGGADGGGSRELRDCNVVGM